MLFTAIAGGVMTAQNLKDIGQVEAAHKTLWFSTMYAVFMIWLQTHLHLTLGGPVIPFLVGYMGAIGLEAYSKQFIEKQAEYPAKSIWKPLLICSVITAPLLVFVIYRLIHPKA
ncbi:hypothetical protein KB206_01900 [Microvirga sp. STS02]|uniref:hypothetical protein n=1 Tax=Hymenobacter negativus TaxID=2795026 RepID=UPI0018DE43C1|nr:MULTISPECIES: hypothetical protein [Bacteria]MBH8567620.1 hypothetical protein [Hymenobacter negativus]MBR7207352.1 hypothetical protein [Microvirga sp. STS02]